MRGCLALACALMLTAASVAGATDHTGAHPVLTELRGASDDPGRIAALQRARQSKSPDAAADVAIFLAEGQVDAVTDAALDTLGALASADTRGILEAFIQHRRAPARARAYTALAALKAPDIDGVIANALRDSAPEVRVLATRLLAERAAKGSVDTLLLALERGVPEAALAIGHLADEPSLGRFAEQLGKTPLDAMLAGYQVLLCRADIDTAAKLDIVATLEEIAGDRVHGFFADLGAARHGCALAARVRAAASASALRTRSKPATSKAPE